MIVGLTVLRQLPVTKIHKTVATRAAPFGPDMHQIVCRLGLCPRAHWGSLQRSSRPPSWTNGPTSKGRGGKERERERRALQTFHEIRQHFLTYSDIEGKN